MSGRGLLGGRYELGAAIGSGGFATVFRARDRRSDAEVAVKLVARGLDSEPMAARLRHEAEILGKFSSRHVPRVHGFGEDENGVWLAMELVDGVPLCVAGLGRALLPHEVLRVARGLLDGLSAAHGARVIHGDVKPSNILVPRTEQALDWPKLVDFGSAELSGARETDQALATARYAAPEVLAGGSCDARGDIYGAGLVLFELLDVGELFDGESPPSRLRARLHFDPQLDERVPNPLAFVLTRMLARDPDRRFQNAMEAHAAIVELDTAPVSSPEPSVPRPRPSRRPLTQPPVSAARMTALPADGVEALAATLANLDLAMLDALARRERGSPMGRIARAAALSLRLELDAAALILEPLTLQSDVARAVGATLLSTRARRVTRARVDTDREDAWVSTLNPVLAAPLVALSASLARIEDSARDEERCKRVRDRLDGAKLDTAWADRWKATLHLVSTVARVTRGEVDAAGGMDFVAPLLSGTAAVAPLDRFVRAVLTARLSARYDEPRAREDLEAACGIAEGTNATLLEAYVATVWGGLLVNEKREANKGLGLLARAGTLLAHGDAPTLEHEAAHLCGLALFAESRWSEAIEQFRTAREAAHAERSFEDDVLSASIEVIAHLAADDRAAAQEVTAVLVPGRLASLRCRPAALAWVARSLEALVSGDMKTAERAIDDACSRARESAGKEADVRVFVEILRLLFDAAKGGSLDVETHARDVWRFAHEHGARSLPWFGALDRVLTRASDARLGDAMREALRRALAGRTEQP